MICRQGSQSCAAEQQRIALSCKCVMFTVSSISGRGRHSVEERRGFLLKTNFRLILAGGYKHDIRCTCVDRVAP